MLSEIELDVLQYLDRTALEGLQIHGRYLRDLVTHNARTLPVRYIHEFDITHNGVYVQLLEDDQHQFIGASKSEQGLEKLFHHVNNAFIRRLKLSFRAENIPLHHCLSTNSSELHCRIGALHVKETQHGVDYASVEFLGRHLRPQVYEVLMYEVFEMSENYAMLFTHNALRGTVKHLMYELDGFMIAPGCIIPHLFGVDGVVENCSITTELDPRPWIVRFTETFKMAERASNIRSATLLYKRSANTSRLHNIFVNTFGRPRRVDAPTPHSAFIKEWLREEYCSGESTTESNVAELFVFENAKWAKKLELFVWTIEQSGEQQNALHYAFLLQVVDVL